MLCAANGNLLTYSGMVLAVAAAVALLILVPPESRADETVIVTIAKDSLTPGCETTRSCLDPSWATVSRGGMVVWDNPTDTEHAMASGTPFSKEDTFETDLILPGDSAGFELDTLGVHQYFCQLHPWIAGFIHVTDAPITVHDPPLHQYDRGVYPEYVTCKEGMHLAYRTSDASPMCLSKPSLKKFAERGLAIPAEIMDTSSRIEADKERLVGLMAGYIKYDDAVITTDNIDDVKEYADKTDYKERVLSQIRLGVTHGFQSSHTFEESAEILRRHVGTPYAEYSQTNIQVPGVDEPDFVKNNADSIYVITQNDTVVEMVDVGDAGRILSPGISPHIEGARYLLLYQDMLVVLSYTDDDGFTTVTLLDVSSENAILAEISLDSELHDARMIDDTIYVMTRSDIDKPPTLYDRLNDRHDDAYMVHLFESSVSSDGLHTITAIPIYDVLQARSYSFVLGELDTVYVSEDNVYISNAQEYSKHKALFADGLFFRHAVGSLEPYELAQLHSIALDGDMDEMAEFVLDSLGIDDVFGLVSKLEAGKVKALDSTTPNTWFVQYMGNLGNFSSSDIRRSDSATPATTKETAIHKIAIDGTKIRYAASGLVDGILIDSFALNQGRDGMLRAITTTDTNGLQSNVYTLDEDMNVVGSLEGIAPGETLHSARFSGDWLYAVTFRQIDPFFVIDVSGTEPKALGILKIPGYSEYLQNYDDTHVIGIGRDTNQNMFDETEDAGIKISMFDVFDFENPREVQSVIVDGRSADSAGLVEHKSLLIDDARGILSIPIRFGDELFFYVYSVNDDYTMDTHSKIPHTYDKSNPHHMRSLYIGDVLYTITPKMIKANDLLQRDVSIYSLDI